MAGGPSGAVVDDCEVRRMAQKMADPRELFIEELGDLLYAERAIEKTLPKLAKEATDPELREGFEHHLDETREQIANLEQVFEELGEKPKAQKCPGIEGIKAEHDEFMKGHDPSEKIRDMFLTGAAARTEHYEIAAYSGLITMAEQIEGGRCVELLQENLEQEESTLRKVESIGKRLAKGAGARA